MNVKYQNHRKIPKDKMSRDMARAAEKICLTLSIAILADVFGFGDKRINRFCEAYNDLAESLGIGDDTIEQIQRNILERFGKKL